ncbi:MAG: hypothetical protein PVH40_04530 [Gemmatimonadales bacterium]|jgi:hypothetical protein
MMSTVSRPATLAAILTLALPAVCLGQGGDPQELCEELRFLSVFLGDWTGHFDDPNETSEIHETWTAILNGHAVRKVRAVPAAEQFESEAIYFYDRVARSVRFIVVTNNGYVIRGAVTYDGDAFTQIGEQTAPDASTRATEGRYRFRDDDTLVEEGGHTIIFERSGSP